MLHLPRTQNIDRLMNYPTATDHFDFWHFVVTVARHFVRSASKHDGDGGRTDFTEVGTQSVV